MKSSNKRQNFRYFKDSTSYEGKYSSRQDVRKSSSRVNRIKTRTNSLRKQIRDTQRLLFKNILDGDALTAQQEKLGRLKKSHLKEKQARSRSKRMKKYRGVKYFDSKKVLKKLTSLTKLINTEPNTEIAELERDYILYKRYLNYTTYFPPEKKYLSLFPNSERLNPNAQEQIDTLIHEINSKVEGGLLADCWDARLANTNSFPSLQNSMTSQVEAESREIEATISPDNSDDDANSSPDFIPIQSDSRTPVGIGKKHSQKLLLSDTGNTNSISDTSWAVIEPLHDSSTNQMLFEENMKSDSFFFFDNTGSDIDTSVFSRRPQKKNFQESRKQADNKKNSKQKSRFQQHKMTEGKIIW